MSYRSSDRPYFTEMRGILSRAKYITFLIQIYVFNLH